MDDIYAQVSGTILRSRVPTEAREKLPETIWQHIEVGPFDHELGSNCWDWTGRLNRNGYGRATVYQLDPQGVLRRHEPVAHRAVYELLEGPIPPKHILDHLCRRHCCVNPKHMEPVTHAENTRRGNAILFKKANDYGSAADVPFPYVPGSDGDADCRSEGGRPGAGDQGGSGAGCGEASEPEGAASGVVGFDGKGEAAGAGESVICGIYEFWLVDKKYRLRVAHCDGEYVATSTDYPSLSHVAATEEEAINGLRDLIENVVVSDILDKAEKTDPAKKVRHVRNTLIWHVVLSVAPWVAGAIAIVFTSLLLTRVFGSN